MAVLGFDLFNRANNATVGNDSNGNAWTEVAGAWEIFSNSLRQTDTATNPGCCRCGTNTNTTEHWAEFRLDASVGGGNVGILLRLDASAFTALSAEWADGETKLIEVSGGSPNTVFDPNIAHTHAPGNVYAASVDSSGVVRFYVNGVLTATSGTTTHANTNTRVGLHLNDSASSAAANQFGKFRFGDGAYPGPEHPVFIGIGTRGAGTTTTTPTLTNAAAGRLAVAHRCIKPSTATATAESGWSQIVNGTGGTGAAGVDVGTTRLSVDTDELAGGEGNPTFDQASTPNSVTSSVTTYDKPSGSTWDVVQTTGDDTGHGTGRAATGAAIALQPGDLLLAICGSDTDSATAFTSPAITASGITFSSTVARLGPGGSATGNDVGSHVWEALVEEGSGTVAPSLSLTGGANNCGLTAFVRLRAVVAAAAVGPPFLRTRQRHLGLALRP